MNSVAQISCNISNSNKTIPLGLEIWLDDKCLLNLDHVANDIKFSHAIHNDPAEHDLRFVMKNKTIEHTRLDDVGNILQDCWLEITDLAFDNVQLGHTLSEKAVYTHDFNGTTASTKEKFYGKIGCNGTVSLQFSTPIYLWLLEHL